MRSELERVTEDMADYVDLDLLRHIIIYGNKRSMKMLSPLIIAKDLRDTKSVPYFNVNMMEKPT